MEGERDTNRWQEILIGGINPEEAQKAGEAIRVLVESGAVITVAQTPNIVKVKITRERDVASDSYTYTQSQEETENNILGYTLPFEHEGKIGFVFISDQSTCSVHFIKKNEHNYQVCNENLAPGGWDTVRERTRSIALRRCTHIF